MNNETKVEQWDGKLVIETIYPHMCRDGHRRVGFRGDGDVCPVCEEQVRVEQVNGVVAALREENARLTAERDRYRERDVCLEKGEL